MHVIQNICIISDAKQKPPSSLNIIKKTTKTNNRAPDFSDDSNQSQLASEVPKPKRKRVVDFTYQPNPVDEALKLQTETNDLLKRIILQNEETNRLLNILVEKNVNK